MGALHPMHLQVPSSVCTLWVRSTFRGGPAQLGALRLLCGCRSVFQCAGPPSWPTGGSRDMVQGGSQDTVQDGTQDRVQDGSQDMLGLGPGLLDGWGAERGIRAMC